MSGDGPKYRQIVSWVKESIASGEYKSGDRLMSEMELSRKFGLSRQTVRHATSELVDEGVLMRVQGSGTYIGAPPSSGIKRSVNGTPETVRRTVRHRRVAVVSTFYESYIFPPTLKGIEGALAKAGYSMQVSFTDNRIAKEEEILKNLLAQDNIDGLIVEPSKSALPNPFLGYYREIQKLGIPIIFFNTFYPEIDAPCIRLDDRRVAEKAAELLIGRGHGKICGIFKPDDGQGRLRYAGFLDAHLKAGLRIEQKRVNWLDTEIYADISVISDYLFERMGGCTGVVCYNDEVAYQVTELALKRGIRIPEDFSVVGIDDSYLAGVSRVPLTSFPHPKEILGRKVGKNLIAMIEDPGFDGNYLYDSEAVIRDSVAGPGRGI